MLADPLVVSENVPSGAAVTSSYTLLQSLPSGAVRKNLAPIGTDYPTSCRIEHSLVGKGKFQRQRHLVRFDAPVYEASVLIPDVTVGMYTVLDLPINFDTSLSRARIWKHMVGLLRGGPGIVAYDGNAGTFYNRWLAGES